MLPVDRLQKKDATGPGNVVVLMGAKTGRDGIGGVSVLASATFTEGSEQRRPSVQVGDPFMEKLLIEACLELYDAELVVGIQDLGGAGLTCALTETAASAGTGMRVWLERVPLREPSMEPHEILASESQERMLLVVAPEKLEAVLKTAEKWGVWATAIGEVTAPESDGSPGRLHITWRDHLVVDVPPGSLVDDGPVYARPMREPADLILLQADRAETLPRPGDPDTLRETVLRMIASPNLCDKTWVTEQYDRYVLGNTVLAQPEDSGVIRIDERTGLGVALSVDGNGRHARLDPYQGAKLALAEAYRNVAVTGATPIAVTDCLNFGSPEDPGVMWQFAEAVRGLADGCAELGIPVTGGNVSFYNQTGAAAIHPTPVVGVLGVLENVADRVASGFVPRAGADHDQLFLLGETHVELSGSEWAWVVHQHLGGVPPHVDLAREKQLAGLLADAARVGHLSSAHDLSDGGLAQSLVESCLRHGVGARIAVPERFEGTSMPFVFLFSESAGRVLVSVPRGHEKAFTALCGEHGVPWELIGVTDPTAGALEVHGQFRIGLDELREAYTGTLPALFGGVQPFEVTAPAVADVVTDEPVGAVDPAADSDTASGVDPAGTTTTGAEQATDEPTPAVPASAEAAPRWTRCVPVAVTPSSPRARRALRRWPRPYPPNRDRGSGSTGAWRVRPNSAGSAPRWWWWTCCRSPHVEVAVGRGMRVHPFPWGEQAAAYARRVGAVAATGRRMVTGDLSRAPVVTDLVLPSPNGSAISAAASATGLPVVAANLRNARAVGRWLTSRGYGSTAAPIGVVAAGERWPDDRCARRWRTSWARPACWMPSPGRPAGSRWRRPRHWPRWPASPTYRRRSAAVSPAES